MKIKVPSGKVVEVGTREELAKAIGEREAEMTLLNEDVKKLKAALRTFAKLEGGEPDEEEKPATVPMEKKATG